MKSISIVAPCYNEQDNLRELYERVRATLRRVGRYRYEMIFIDNASTDRSVEIIKAIAARDRNVKLIVNARNFGHIRSPMHALFQARGDAVIVLASDLQDPPELIEELIGKWEQGFSCALCVKRASEENPAMYWMRTKYYRVLKRLSSVDTLENFTGFGLYDRKIVDILKSMNDPYPYFRGLIAEIGLPYAEVAFTQPRRQSGITKNNFYTLYDLAMLGVVNLSRVPLRVVTFLGFSAAAVSFLVGMAYLLFKLFYWNSFALGVAPLVVGLFFLGSLQLISLGILGEYIGAIHTQVQNRPYVIERERVNFEFEPGEVACNHQISV